MKFKIVGDSLIYIDEGHNIVKGENEYDIIEIEAPHYRNSIDSMSLSFRLTATSAEDHSKSACQILIKKEISESKIILIGSVTSDFSAIPGKVLFMVTGTNSSGITAVFDSTRPIEIRDNISLASLPNQSAAEQLFNQAQLEVQKAMDAAAETREMLDNFTLDVASETVVGGIKSGNDISVSFDGIVTVNSVNGKTVGKSIPADAVFTDTVYTLPKATKKILGGVKVDGTSIIADKNGVISAVGGKNSDGQIIIPTASTETLGGVKVDGKSITASEDGTISALDSENLRAEITELKSIIGYTDGDIIGLHANFENNIFSRLGAAVGLNGGSDFDKFPMYGGRRRCNVLDDGTITAYYGDTNFVEDGSNGQVMVYQPKFYYKVVPLKLDPITDGIGYHLRCANYYISATPKNGFKLHPAFYDETGNPVDYILFSAYEGSIFDSSENVYLQNDEQIANFAADKLSSVSNVKPCSGKTQTLTRANAELLAANRGSRWHCDTIRTLSANQFLMILECACFNVQTVIGRGAFANKGHINTGGTSALGNLTGSANGSPSYVSISYRGMENPYGNLWKFANGINLRGNSLQKSGIPYICTDYNFAENKSDDNYESAGFMLANEEGYVSAFGYSSKYDWLFLTSETYGTTSFPVGDNYCCTPNLNGYRAFAYGSNNGYGIFCNNTNVSEKYKHSQYIGCRLIYIPNGDNA